MLDLIGSVIAANPCPPLPLISFQVSDGKSRLRYLNTHHILMQSYAHAIQRDDPSANEVRKATQLQLTHELMTVFVKIDATPEALYNSASTFTRSYLHSFFPKMQVPDARFAPYDEVAKDTPGQNPIVRAASEHLAGMILYDECPVEGDDTLDEAFVQPRSYSDIVESLNNKPFSQLLSMYGDVHRKRMGSGSIEVVEDDEGQRCSMDKPANTCI
jgi:hypothetical protein